MQVIAPSNPSSNSVPEAVHAAYVWSIAAAAALGGLLFGYDWVVIGGARQFYELYFHLTSPQLIGWANSCALLGCLVGSLGSGYGAERFGRRKLLITAALLFAVSSVATGWATSFFAFIFWRIAGGVAIGISSNVAPLYIAEISPAPLRGRLVSINQFTIVIGILLAQVVNWAIARPIPVAALPQAFYSSWNVQFAWRWMFTVLTLPSAIFLIASYFLPESPRWLLAHGREDIAASILRRIGGDRYAAAELASIRSSVTARPPSVASWKSLTRPGVRRIVLIAVALAVLQQWSGINILFNYAAEVYRSAGYGSNDIFLNIVITGSINLLFTILAIVLVDSLGRRKLMLLGCAGIAASHLFCALAYRHHYLGRPVLVLTLCAIACYALTLAPVTWVLISELFPNEVRSYGVAAAVSSLWISSFLLTYTFPLLDHTLGTGNTFFIYGLFCVAGIFLVYFFVPETKGRSLDQNSIGATLAP
ncbi:MAG: sugar porter family MFS transporter [Acidobacteriota bacterium]